MRNSFGRARWPAPLSILALLAACTTDVPTASSEGAVAVTASALSAADVARVTITVTAPDIDKPVVADLVKVGGNWQGVIGKIPAGTGRRFHGDAYNAANALIFTGDLDNVTIQKNTTAAVSVLLQQHAAPVPFQNAAPVIDGMVASTNTPGVGDEVSLTLAAHDVDPGDTLTYDWSATGGTVTKNGAGTSATWLAPQTAGTYEITALVTDSKSSIAAISFTTNVDAGKGSASTTAAFNTWPLVTRVIATPSRLDVGETSAIVLDASDVDGDPLTYAWTASCAGTFAQPGAPNPSFTLTSLPAGGTCDLNVSVGDGRGGGNTGKLTIATGPAPAVAYLPEVDSTFQSSATSDGADTITFRIGAHDPQSGAVGFSWWSSTGTLAVPTTTAANSEVVWSAPSCLAAPATITATVTSATGTKQHTFSVTPTAAAVCCLPAPAGLVGWWRGESNDPGDHLGINSTGLGNGLTYGPGKVGQAYYFTDPTTRVEATTSGFPTGSADRTIEQWIQVTAENPPGVFELFFSGYGSFGQFNSVFALGAQASDRKIFLSNWGGAVYGNLFPLNEWHHLAVTYSGAEIVRLYFDGANVTTASMPNLATAANTKLYWGRYDDYRHFTGAMDELSVYNRALSQSEISAIVGAGSKGKCH